MHASGVLGFQYKRGRNILAGPHLEASGTPEQRGRELGLYSRGNLINAYKYLVGE